MLSPIRTTFLWSTYFAIEYLLIGFSFFDKFFILAIIIHVLAWLYIYVTLIPSDGEMTAYDIAVQNNIHSNNK